MYNIIQGLAMIIYIITFIFYGKCYGFSKFKSFLLGFSAVVIDYLVIILITWIDNGFTGFGQQNAVRVFVFNPLIIFIMAKVSNVDFRKFCDFNAFPAMLWYGLGHLACIAEGCCHGFAYYEGTTMYNIAHSLTGTNMLPNQIIESVGALLISAILLFIGIKKRFNTKGYMYYLMLILYGTQRFVLEFFRDNEKVIVFSELQSANGQFGISNLALWAVAMTVVGTVLLTITAIKDKKAEKV